MQPILTPKMLSSICHDITSGRPLWGLIRANEHLDSSHPLHSALCVRAKQIINLDNSNQLKALTIVATGARFSELDSATSAAVKSEPIKTDPVVHKSSMTLAPRTRTTTRRSISRIRVAHQRRKFENYAISMQKIDSRLNSAGS